MEYKDLKTLPKTTADLIFESMRIYSKIKDNIIVIDNYSEEFIIKNNDIFRRKEEENTRLKKQDKIILSLYLSFLKIDSPIKYKLNDIGLYYNDVFFHLNIISKQLPSHLNYKKLYNKAFLNTLTKIKYSNGNTLNLKPTDSIYFHFLYETLYVKDIVGSKIVENLLLDMDLYNEYLESFNTNNQEIEDEKLKSLSLISKIKNHPKINKKAMFKRILFDYLNKEETKQKRPAKVLEFKRKKDF